MKFKVYEIELDRRSTEDNAFGGDMNSLGSLSNQKKALVFAKKASMKSVTTTGKVLHEIWIEKEEENEITEQWAIKNGKIVHHDANV